MTACNPFRLDPGACAAGAFNGLFDFLTGWVWGLPVLAIVLIGLVILGVAYRQGGIPGLAAAAVGIGYVLGRRQRPDTAPGPPGGYVLTEKDRKAVQRALAAQKLYFGREDGVLGRQSQAAIRKLQLRIGEPATGTLTPRVLAALGLNLGRRD